MAFTTVHKLLLLAALIGLLGKLSAAPTATPTASPAPEPTAPEEDCGDEEDATRTPTTEPPAESDDSTRTPTEPASGDECEKELPPAETQRLLDTFLLKNDWIRENVSSLCNSSSRDERVRANFYPCADCRPFSSSEYVNLNLEGLVLSESIFYVRCYITFFANQSAIALSETIPRDNRQQFLLESYSNLDVHREARDLVKGTGGRVNACQVSNPAESCPEIPTDAAISEAAMCELKDLTTDLKAIGGALRDLLEGEN